VRDLNYLYRSRPALHARDCEPEGFEWLIADDAREFGFCLAAQGAGRKAPIAVISNFTPVYATTIAYRCRRPASGGKSSTPTPNMAVSGKGNGGMVTARQRGRRRGSGNTALPPLATDHA
jgi:1,4-alpha-glucan branching enzyme